MDKKFNTEFILGRIFYPLQRVKRIHRVMDADAASAAEAL